MTPRMYMITSLLLLVLVSFSPAQTFTTLHNFTGGSDGGFSNAGLIQDPSGNLYGTTVAGGDLRNGCAPYGCGVVFKLNTSGKETVLHAFHLNDGGLPYGPVTRDKAGNTYGTTVAGGSSSGSYGTVFKIDTAGKERVLYNFQGGSDGCAPYQGLIMDQAGNLYGTTLSCPPPYFYGTIFKVDRAGKFTILHGFAGSDGANPGGGHLTMDKAGNLYGVASFGGAYNRGVLYKLSKSGKFTLLYSFKGGTADGWSPGGTVVLDRAGNLYGTTALGGSSQNGIIWKVSPTGKETILHTFAGGASDGCAPYDGVTLDSQGNLYGLTPNCGVYNSGVLYKLSKSGTLTLLHTFDISDGALPSGEVLRTSEGTLFGTTADGGTGSNGTLWSYTP